MASSAKRLIVFGGGLTSSLLVFNAVDRTLFKKRQIQNSLLADASLAGKVRLREILYKWLICHFLRTKEFPRDIWCVVFQWH